MRAFEIQDCGQPFPTRAGPTVRLVDRRGLMPSGSHSGAILPELVVVLHRCYGDSGRRDTPTVDRRQTLLMQVIG
jgi:hypothetical protein